MNPKQPIPIHIIVKMPQVKNKERTLKVAGERQLVTYKGAPIRLLADFSTETFQSRKDLHEILQVMKSKRLQPRLFYPAKLSVRIKAQIKHKYKRATNAYVSTITLNANKCSNQKTYSG